MSVTGEHEAFARPASEVISSAGAVAHAIQHLCRTMLTRQIRRPAEVDNALPPIADLKSAAV